jgi:hypothetical protein
MAMALEKMKLTRSRKVKIIQEAEENSNMSQNEIVKCFVLPRLSLCNTILRTALILEEEVGVGHILRNKKTYFVK